jgi:hypothetical protein
MTTVAELLNRTRESYDEFKQAIAAVPQETVTKPDTIGTWSVRDVIAHVGADELWMAGQIEALHFGTLPTVASCYGIDTPPPAGMDWNSQDARNAWQRDRLRDLSLEDVRAMAAEAHARLLAAITLLQDSQLGEPLAIGELGTVGHIRKPHDGETAWPLWEWLRGVTYHHYADHVEALRALAGRPASG